MMAQSGQEIAFIAQSVQVWALISGLGGAVDLPQPSPSLPDLAAATATLERQPPTAAPDGGSRLSAAEGTSSAFSGEADTAGQPLLPLEKGPEERSQYPSFASRQLHLDLKLALGPREAITALDEWFQNDAYLSK